MKYFTEENKEFDGIFHYLIHEKQIIPKVSTNGELKGNKLEEFLINPFTCKIDINELKLMKIYIIIVILLLIFYHLRLFLFLIRFNQLNKLHHQFFGQFQDLILMKVIGLILILLMNIKIYVKKDQ